MIVLYSWLSIKIYHKNLMIWIFFFKIWPIWVFFSWKSFVWIKFIFFKLKIEKWLNISPKKLCLKINEIIFTNVLYEHLSFIFGQTRDKTCIGWKHWSFGTWNVLSHVFDHHMKCFVLVVLGTWRWTI
jgi:hypothetical protein